MPLLRSRRNSARCCEHSLTDFCGVSLPPTTPVPDCAALRGLHFGRYNRATMSVIDDLRQLLQDLVTPEFRALSVRVDALEKKIDVRVDALEKKVDAGFIALEKKTDAGRADLKQEMADTEARAERRHTALLIALQLEERVKRLEQDRITSHEQRT